VRLVFYLEHFIDKYLFAVEFFKCLRELARGILGIGVRFGKSVDQRVHHKIALRLRCFTTFRLIGTYRSVPDWCRFKKWLDT